MVEIETIVSEKNEQFSQKRWYQLFIIGVMGLLFFNISMLYLAMPSIAASLHVTFEARWLLLSYGLPFIFGIFINHQLIARFGARQMALIGISLFTIGSTLCGTALLFWQLIFFQVIQGIGGFLFWSSLQSVAEKHSVISKKHQQIAVLVGGIMGLLAGGIVVDLMNWHLIFFLNLPFGLAFYYLGLWLLPRTNANPESPINHIDSFLTIFVFFFVALGFSPYWDVMGIPTFLFLLFALGIFLWIQFRQKGIDRHSFVFHHSKNDFWSNFFVRFIHALIGSALAFLFPFFFAQELKWQMFGVGLLMIGFFLIMAGGTLIRKRFFSTISESIHVFVSSVILLVGLILCLPLNPEWNVFDLIIRIAILGIGFGFYPFKFPTSWSPSSVHTNQSLFGSMGWFFGPVLCTLIWTPNHIDLLSTRMDMRIALFVLILMIFGSLVYLISRRLGKRSEDQLAE